MKVIVSLLALCALANTGYARSVHQSIAELGLKPNEISALACEAFTAHNIQNHGV